MRTCRRMRLAPRPPLDQRASRAQQNNPMVTGAEERMTRCRDRAEPLLDIRQRICGAPIEIRHPSCPITEWLRGTEACVAAVGAREVHLGRRSNGAFVRGTGRCRRSGGDDGGPLGQRQESGLCPGSTVVEGLRSAPRKVLVSGRGGVGGVVDYHPEGDMP